MKTCFSLCSYNRTVKWQRFIRNDYAPGGRPTRVPLFVVRVAQRVSIHVRSLTRSYYPSSIARVLARIVFSLHRQLNSSPLEKKPNALSIYRWNILLLPAKKKWQVIFAYVEAVVSQLVGTLGYDLSRVHRYSKLFETWGTSVGEFPIAAPYSRSNTNVRLRVADCVRDSGNSHLAGGPRAPIVRRENRGRDTRIYRETYDRFYYWPSLNLRELLSQLHNHWRNLRQTIGLFSERRFVVVAEVSRKMYVPKLTAD